MTSGKEAILEISARLPSTGTTMRYYLLGFVALVACKPASGKGNPDTNAGGGTDPASLAPFSTISNEGTADIDITVGAPQTVSVACSDGPTSRVSLGVAGSKLTVKTPRNENPRCKVTLAIPSLTELASEGTGTIAVHGKTALTKVMADGTGAIDVEAVEADTLNVISDGTGALTFAGKATTATFKLGGVAKLVAKDLAVESVKLTLDGAGGATVNATKKADIALTGVGSATVYGNPPEKIQKKDGLGTITFK